MRVPVVRPRLARRRDRDRRFRVRHRQRAVRRLDIVVALVRVLLQRIRDHVRCRAILHVRDAARYRDARKPFLARELAHRLRMPAVRVRFAVVYERLAIRLDLDLSRRDRQIISYIYNAIVPDISAILTDDRRAWHEFIRIGNHIVARVAMNISLLTGDRNGRPHVTRDQATRRDGRDCIGRCDRHARAALRLTVIWRGNRRRRNRQRHFIVDNDDIGVGINGDGYFIRIRRIPADRHRLKFVFQLRRVLRIRRRIQLITNRLDTRLVFRDLGRRAVQVVVDGIVRLIELEVQLEHQRVVAGDSAGQHVQRIALRVRRVGVKDVFVVLSGGFIAFKNTNGGIRRACALDRSAVTRRRIGQRAVLIQDLMIELHRILRIGVCRPSAGKRNVIGRHSKGSNFLLAFHPTVEGIPRRGRFSHDRHIRADHMLRACGQCARARGRRAIIIGNSILVKIVVQLQLQAAILDDDAREHILAVIPVNRIVRERLRVVRVRHRALIAQLAGLGFVGIRLLLICAVKLLQVVFDSVLFFGNWLVIERYYDFVRQICGFHHLDDLGADQLITIDFRIGHLYLFVRYGMHTVLRYNFLRHVRRDVRAVQQIPHAQLPRLQLRVYEGNLYAVDQREVYLIYRRQISRNLRRGKVNRFVRIARTSGGRARFFNNLLGNRVAVDFLIQDGIGGSADLRPLGVHSPIFGDGRVRQEADGAFFVLVPAIKLIVCARRRSVGALFRIHICRNLLMLCDGFRGKHFGIRARIIVFKGDRVFRRVPLGVRHHVGSGHRVSIPIDCVYKLFFSIPSVESIVRLHIARTARRRRRNQSSFEFISYRSHWRAVRKRKVERLALVIDVESIADIAHIPRSLFIDIVVIRAKFVVLVAFNISINIEPGRKLIS